MFGVPFLYVILGLLHPTANPALGDDHSLFIGLHIAPLFLIMGSAFVLWLLVEGVAGRAATVARVLIIPFVVAYTALDAILRIAGASWWSRRTIFRPRTRVERVGWL